MIPAVKTMSTLVQRAAVILTVGVCSTLARAETRVDGGGATFPAPIYKRWVEEYQARHPDVKINYEAQGSGFGIKGIIARTLDFAGSDAPMSKKELAEAKVELVHIPTVAGAVVAAYNLPGVQGDLKLSGPVLADIFAGKISRWNDPKLVALNEGVQLPDMAITPAYRTDGSGTTFVFTNYLATQSEDFKSTIGMGKEVKWPAGQGGKGNAGVTAVVQQTGGSVGYVELNFALQNKLPFALVQNRAGKFVKASPETVSAAGEGALDKMTKSLAVNIWDQPGEATYPISAFTYIIIPTDLTGLNDSAKARAIVDFIRWATHEGQASAKAMDYAPLSPGVQQKVRETLAAVKL